VGGRPGIEAIKSLIRVIYPVLSTEQVVLSYPAREVCSPSDGLGFFSFFYLYLLLLFEGN